MTQSNLGFAPGHVDKSDSDSYCTPPDVMAPVHEMMSPEGVTLDPWTNHYAISHGWVGAKTAWTIEDGRDPDLTMDDRPWPITSTSFVWGNPPYSGPEEYIERFIHEVQLARCWGMLLVKTDNRPKWWTHLGKHASHIVLWRGPVNFYLDGRRKKGNNFPSTIAVIDATKTTPTRRRYELSKAFERPALAWVYQ